MSEPGVKDHRVKRALFIVMVLTMVVAWYTWLNKYLTFENIKANRDVLYSFVEEHYLTSVLVYVAAVVSTGFFVPAAIPMILVGGFLFGILWGTVYVSVGFLVGATLAFLFSKYLIGSWVQHKYGGKLEAFNGEVSRHGRNYLILLRMVPLFPFFTVNYFAGLTRISLSRYMISTAVGMLPCSVVYAFAGRELGKIESPADIMSPKFLVALALLAFFALLPVMHHHVDKAMARRRGVPSDRV